MFENRKIEVLGEPVHISRIIASWRNEGGRIGYGYVGFKSWLIDELKLSKDDAEEINEIACCGKMELEKNAKEYIKSKL
jgi:hypothetical protein